MLLVGPQTTNMPGVQPVGRMAFAEMLEWELEAFDKAFGEALDEGLAKADWKARFVFVPNAIHHNLPQSPNVVTSWGSTWARVPECNLKKEAWHTIRSALLGMDKSYVDAFEAACPLGSSDNDADSNSAIKPFSKASGKASVKPSSKPSRNQEQEQEQEQEYKKHTLADASPPAVADVSAENPKAKTLGLRDLIAEGVDRKHAESWLAARRAKRLPLTPSALDGVKQEAEKAGMTLQEAIAKAATEGWAGFKASWLQEKPRGGAPEGTPEGFNQTDYGPGGML